MKTLALLSYRLFSAWHYLKIKDESTFHAIINWFAPIVLGISITIVIFLIDCFFPVLIMKDALQFFSNGNSQYFFFPGFFLTALAAIAVFEKHSLDCPLPGSKMYLYIQGRAGIKEDRPLTRRLLLSLMFSFLTVHSLTFCIILLLISNFGSRIYNSLSNISTVFAYICMSLSLFVVLVVFFQILFNMLIGLYYLGERFPANYDVEPTEKSIKS